MCLQTWGGVLTATSEPMHATAAESANQPPAVSYSRVGHYDIIRIGSSSFFRFHQSI